MCVCVCMDVQSEISEMGRHIISLLSLAERAWSVQLHKLYDNWRGHVMWERTTLELSELFTRKPCAPHMAYNCAFSASLKSFACQATGTTSQLQTTHIMLKRMIYQSVGVKGSGSRISGGRGGHSCITTELSLDHNCHTFAPSCNEIIHPTNHLERERDSNKRVTVPNHLRGYKAGEITRKVQ